jgi:hypothetical protein
MKPEAPLLLCYVQHPWAYFTTAPLAEQVGDDWDDAPYEHNAGEPYDFASYDFETQAQILASGKKGWKIVKVAFDGPFDSPSEGHYNSPYSVIGINKGEVPWLRLSRWGSKPNLNLEIWAGTTLEEFRNLIHEGGGEVYLPGG